MSFITHENQGLIYLTSSLLSTVPHAFSTRTGGVSPAPWDSLNLRVGQGDGPEALQENYRRILLVVGGDPSRVVLSHQVHETTVRIVTQQDAGKGLLRPWDYTADALITDVTDLPLVVLSADCGTVLLQDPETGAVGAVHAGWRGCAGGIVQKAVEQMVRTYGCRPENLRCALGPCIGPCCFETDDDVVLAMRAALGAKADLHIHQRGKKYHVDLAGLNVCWLQQAGIAPAHIDVCGECTACRPEHYWSHRKMGNARGVQAAIIMRRGGSSL